MTGPASTRARRWFWLLVAIAILAMSGLYQSISADPSMWAGLGVLGSSLLLLGATAQATRILLAMDRQQRPRPRGGTKDSAAARAGSRH